MDNIEVHKFLKSLTQGTEAWKCIEKWHGGCQAIQSLIEYYDGAAEGELRMNATKADLNELYFKYQDVLFFEKYVNWLK